MTEQSLLTEQQKTDIRRLAEAMRAGAAVRPQGFGVLFNTRAQWKESERTHNKICSCAMGAAWEGAHPEFNARKWITNSEQNKADTFRGLSDVEEHFNLKPQIETRNPIDGAMHEVVGIVIDLNDRARWTREAIADWLLSLTFADRKAEVDYYWGMKIKDWPDSLRNSMNNVKPGSGDGIAETIYAWIEAGKIELNCDLKPKI